MTSQFQGMRAGVGKSDITHRAEGVEIRDPLYSKALVLEDGAVKVAIITMDTTAIGGRRIGAGYLEDVSEAFLPKLRERIERELQIPGGNIMVNASHTHPPGKLLCEDQEQIDRTFEAVKNALENLTEVKVGSGVGFEDRITVNRTLRLKSGLSWSVRQSNPCPPDEDVAGVGPIDPSIGIIRIDRLDGTPLAVVYNFACHIGDINGGITAGFTGIASRIIEENLGHGAMAFFLQGAAGDIIDVIAKDYNRPSDIEPLGMRLGLSALSAYRKIQTQEGKLSVKLETVEFARKSDFSSVIESLCKEQSELIASLRSTSLNFKTFLPLYLKQAISPEFPSDYAHCYLNEKANGRDNLVSMDAFIQEKLDKYLQNILSMEKLARIQDRIATLKKHQEINAASGEATITAEIQGIKIGDCVIITSPAELLVEVGLNIKTKSPYKHTFVAGFSNGYLHYGPLPEAYERGGYEVTECLLAPSWHQLFEQTALQVIGDL